MDENIFSGETIEAIRRVLNNRNYRVVALLMSHKRRKFALFNMLGSSFIESLTVIFVYISLFTKRKISPLDNSFEKFTFNDISSIGITEVLLNIMPCHVFSKEENKIVILT